MLSTCPSVRPFVCYQPYEHDILKTNEPNTSGRYKGMKLPTLGSEGQRSRSYETEDRIGGLAEASFSTILVE